eukprot:scaffold1525_cov142-Cylindrotheca_fusiformis.AAC.138
MAKKYKQITSNGSNRSAGSHGSAHSYSDDDDDDMLNGDIVDLQAADPAVHENEDDSDDDEEEEDEQEEHSPLKGDGTGILSSPTRSQPSTFSPVAFVRDSSFTFDDEDDEDEENLKRYNLDFSIDADQAILTNSAHGGTSPESSSQQNVSSIFQYLWMLFQGRRQQARQRRAQLLLQQSERDLRQSLWICVSTYCDATDRGIMLVVALLLLWIVLLLTVSDDDFRRHWFVSGLILFVVRVSARPLWDYFSKQRQRLRVQSHDRQSHSPLPTQSPVPKQLRKQTNSHDECDGSPQGRYLDEPPENGNLELPSMT